MAIQLSGLTKFYGRAKVAAIEDVSLKIAKGEVYGFLGSNGAGKSTTIRTVMGFLYPSAGTIKILGKDMQEHGVALKQDIGYLSGDVVLPRKTTGRKLLKYLGDLHGNVDEEYLNVLVDRFEAQLDKRTGTLSKGNRQKIGLVQAFMHQPKVLVLDEPTSGLDPLMQEQFYKTVEEAKARGAAIFLSSHSFNEVERICDRIGIIREGKLVHEGPVAKLLAERLPSWRVVLKKQSDVKTLEASKLVKLLEKQGKTVVVEPTETIESALGVLSKVGIASMSMVQQELEDEFMIFYTDTQEVSQ
jgi:ABC-2 type transport system ATP-binding protein